MQPAFDEASGAVSSSAGIRVERLGAQEIGKFARVPQ